MMVAASLLEQPHHDGAELHVPQGAPALGDVVPVFVRVPQREGASRAWVRTTPDAEPRFVAGRIDHEEGSERWWRFDVEVRNPLSGYRFLLDGGPHGYRWLNGTGVHTADVTDAADFKLSTAPPPPRWAGDAIVYQVFPDRFGRSAAAGHRPAPAWARPAGWDDPVIHNGQGTGLQLYGGDLDGIAEHLDHIEALGADTLYLTPFFPAVSNHRYNASSFEEVDPLLGGNRALAMLAREVHARGWHLVGDLTANHCGDTHPWFRRAVEDPTSQERGFFYFADSGEDGDGGYESWLGFSSLPKFRHSSAALRSRLLQGPGSVAARWLRPPFELDGWRVDVANMTGRHRDDDFNAEVARTLRLTLAGTRPDTLLLAEHCHDATPDIGGDGWQGAMNYAGFTRPVWAWLRHPGVRLPFMGLPVATPRLGAETLHETMRAFTAAAPWQAMRTSWSLLGSHDSARIRTVVRYADLGEVAAGLLFTMPGAPMVFAGDEIGLEGVDGEAARQPFPWHRPERWDRETLGHYRALGALRISHDALRRGGLRWAHAKGHAMAFLRESQSERLLVLAARAPHRGVHLTGAGLGLRGEAPNLYGGAGPLCPGPDDILTLPGDGPTFQVWQLA